jgi:hypothetical protein
MIFSRHIPFWCERNLTSKTQKEYKRGKSGGDAKFRLLEKLQYPFTAVLYLTLYMDFRGEFKAIFPYLVLNVKLLVRSQYL